MATKNERLSKNFWCMNCNKRTQHFTIFSGDLSLIQEHFCLECHPQKGFIEIIQRVLIDELRTPAGVDRKI